MKSVAKVFSKFSAHALALATFALLSSSALAATDGPYSMEVLVNNHSTQEYYHHGKTYIQARDGHEYSIRLTNHTGERVAVALSVDGLNSIDAKHTSAYNARKWVLDPYESITIDGWQTSSWASRHFYFTNEAQSYGAWLGKTRDLGNISAAFFPEKKRRVYTYRYKLDDHDGGYPRGGRALEESESAQMAPRARKSERAAIDSRSGAGLGASEKARSSSRANDYAATGIGREVENQVYTVAFKHERTPAAVMTVRYEFRPKLVELGVLPRWRPSPMSRRERSSGFTDYGYAPDPYDHR